MNSIVNLVCKIFLKWSLRILAHTHTQKNPHTHTPYEQIGPIVWVSIILTSKVSYCRIKYMEFDLRLH